MCPIFKVEKQENNNFLPFARWKTTKIWWKKIKCRLSKFRKKVGAKGLNKNTFNQWSLLNVFWPGTFRGISLSQNTVTCLFRDHINKDKYRKKNFLINTEKKKKFISSSVTNDHINKARALWVPAREHAQAWAGTANAEHIMRIAVLFVQLFPTTANRWTNLVVN